MKPDISTREDIQTVVRLFYDKIMKDDRIGFFFSDVVAVNWEPHLAAMCGFWENVLFYTGEYEGNPLDTHRRINLQHRTTAQHFGRWLELFDETVDTHFAGPNADKMKRHAQAIATVMQQKM